MALRSARNLQLDVLRGVAILLVFGRHLELPRPNGVVGSFVDGWHRLGWVGVDLFFVLSGFLIGGLLLTELERHGRINIPRFLVRRGLKLYPGYFVFLVYLLLMPTAKALGRGEDVTQTFAAQWILCWPNFLFLQNYLWTPAGHTWSLAVEEHFYLLLPFVLLLVVRLGRVQSLIQVCLIAVPVFLSLRWLSVWTGDQFAETMSASHLRIEALLFGVGIRAVAQFRPEWFRAARSWRPHLVALSVAMWMPNLFIEPSTAYTRTFGLTFTFLGAAGLLVAAYHTRAADFGRASWMVEPVARMLGWIGVYSYGIYLWHVTAFRILERQVLGFVVPVAGTSPISWLLGTAVVCVGAVVIGALASRLVEEPVLRLRDHFFPSRSAPLPSSSRAGVPGLNAVASVRGPAGGPAEFVKREPI